MALKTADQIVEKYQRGIQGAGADYAAGVQSPSKPWQASTIAGAERWRTGIQEAINNRSFEKGVNAAGDQKWQQRAASLGAQRYAASASEAAAAYQKQAQKIMAAASTARSAAAALPNATMEQRLQRATTAMRASSDYWKGQKRG